MTHYVVDLDIHIGEYGKTSITGVIADNEEDAQRMALCLEAHGPARFISDTELDDYGPGFSYTVADVTEPSPEEVAVLSRYIAFFDYSQELINRITKR